MHEALLLDVGRRDCEIGRVIGRELINILRLAGEQSNRKRDDL